MIRTAALAVLLTVAPSLATGQDRPSEDEVFGAPSPQPSPPLRGGEGEREKELFGAPSPPPTPQPGGGESEREEELFGAPSPRPSPPLRGGEGEREKEDPLRLGGQLYLRAQSLLQEGKAAADAPLSSPNLLDVYLDVRPNDRVRAFALGRMSYDPTAVPADAFAAFGHGVLTIAPPTTPVGPRGALDQLWLNFDVERRAFVTAGKQHVKWGVGRFWNPTDYLHPVRRDPLAVFDVRTGTTMLKVHVPWESRGWNLYGVAVLEDVAGALPERDGRADGTNRLGRVGGGGRAEVVLGTVELGADALAQSGHRPRFGVDVSAGIWELDLYAEAALRSGVDTPRWRKVPGVDPSRPLLEQYERHDPDGFTPQLTVGGSWSRKYSDEDVVTFGAEYFYDRSGYTSPRIYPVLLGVTALSAAGDFQLLSGSGPGAATVFNPVAGEPSPFTPFYLGRHYGAAFASLPAPGSWNDTTFTLSVIGNLSDASFVARLDHSVLLLTYLGLETYVAGHFGAREGEFRLGIDVPRQQVVPGLSLGFSSAPLLVEAGIALRVSL